MEAATPHNPLSFGEYTIGVNTTYDAEIAHQIFFLAPMALSRIGRALRNILVKMILSIVLTSTIETSTP